MTAKGKVLPAVSDITLDDCLLQFGKVPGIEDWYEDHYYLILGEIDGYDFFLCSALVVHKGGYHIQDGVMNTTTFIMLPKSTRGRMLDNHYITGDQAPWQYLNEDDLKITREKDRVVWKVPEKELVARPPYWEVHSNHKGLEMDLVAHSICPGFWYMGKFEDIEKNMAAGIDQYIQAEGTITIEGKKYEISHAGGLYEHVALPAWDQVSLVKKARYLWMVGWAEDIQFFTFYFPGMDRYYGRVIIDGNPLSFEGISQVSVDEREFWGDPKTGFTICSKWQIIMSSPDGAFNATLDNGGRSLHVNALKNGYIGRFWNLALANGSFTFPDGRVIPVENMRVGVDRSTAFSTFE